MILLDIAIATNRETESYAYFISSRTHVPSIDFGKQSRENAKSGKNEKNENKPLPAIRVSRILPRSPQPMAELKNEQRPVSARVMRFA